MPKDGEGFDSGLHPPHADLALEYLSIVRTLKTPTPWSGVKGHLFKLMRPGLARELDLRDRMGRVRKDDLDGFEALCREMKARMDVRASLSFVLVRPD
jgi:tRNA-dihydrouridine synthase 1